jgi:hypothetical protein
MSEYFHSNHIVLIMGVGLGSDRPLMVDVDYTTSYQL